MKSIKWLEREQLFGSNWVRQGNYRHWGGDFEKRQFKTYYESFYKKSNIYSCFRKAN